MATVAALQNLTGAQHEKLVKALMGVYRTVADLRIFVDFKLSRNLDEFAEVTTLKTATFELVRWAESEGLIEPLVKGAVDDYKGNPPLLAIASELGLSPSDEARQQLDRVMAAAPAGRFAALQQRFAGASAGIASVAYYKQLHDVLHDVQFLCVTQLPEPIKRYANDQKAVDEVHERAADLRRQIERAFDLAQPNLLTSVEVIPWVKKLLKAGVLLDEAERQVRQPANGPPPAGPRTLDYPRKLAVALLTLRDVTRTEPGRIDERMQRAAQSLGLAEMMADLRHVGDSLPASAGPETREPITAAVTALDALATNIQEALKAHTDWQGHDNLLQLIQDAIELNPGDGTEQLCYVWADLQGRMEQLLAHHLGGPKWEDLERQVAWLASLIAARPDPAAPPADGEADKAIRQAFKEYRETAAQAFYTVDKQFNDFCKSLGALGDTFARLGGKGS